MTFSTRSAESRACRWQNSSWLPGARKNRSAASSSALQRYQSCWADARTGASRRLRRICCCRLGRLTGGGTGGGGGGAGRGCGGARDAPAHERVQRPGDLVQVQPQEIEGHFNGEKLMALVRQ